MVPAPGFTTADLDTVSLCPATSFYVRSLSISHQNEGNKYIFSESFRQSYRMFVSNVSEIETSPLAILS